MQFATLFCQDSISGLYTTSGERILKGILTNMGEVFTSSTVLYSGVYIYLEDL
jgi:hypothetical protein